jgi:hypothetical protein
MRTVTHWAVSLGLLVATMVPAGAQTTTSSTTTTTLFGGCVAGPSYDSILCRIDALVAFVQSAIDLGRVKGGVTSSAQKARRQCGKASQAGTGKVVSNQLKKCAKTLDTFRHKLASHSARQIVPETTRAHLRDDVAAPIRTDVNTLRGKL